jgi:hypothetical protein
VVPNSPAPGLGGTGNGPKPTPTAGAPFKSAPRPPEANRNRASRRPTSHAKRDSKPKRRIKQPGGDRQEESGTELLVNDLGEHHATFSVAFEGDHEAAVAATGRWIERVERFGGIASIDHASPRGADGTNMHHFSEEIEALADSVDEETRAEFAGLIDPKRDADV